MVKLMLKGTTLCIDGSLDAAAVYRLAQWACRMGPITINERELTADELKELAKESECSRKPVRFPGRNGSSIQRDNDP